MKLLRSLLLLCLSTVSVQSYTVQPVPSDASTTSTRNRIHRRAFCVASATSMLSILAPGLTNDHAAHAMETDTTSTTTHHPFPPLSSGKPTNYRILHPSVVLPSTAETMVISSERRFWNLKTARNTFRGKRKVAKYMSSSSHP